MAFKPLSESASLNKLTHLLDQAINALRTKSDRNQVVFFLVKAMGIAVELEGQAAAGIHRNPMLVTFNPPRDLHGQVKIASDVQGILYRHDKDREFYFHSFGGEEVELKNMGGGAVMIDPLPGRTGVEAFVVRNPNKRKEAVAVVLRHKDGLPIAEDL